MLCAKMVYLMLSREVYTLLNYLNTLHAVCDFFFKRDMIRSLHCVLHSSLFDLFDLSSNISFLVKALTL